MKQLPVMEHFYTIQGEGAYTGQAAYFIRLGGCDIGCTWCDVKDSWDANAHTHYSINEIVSWVKTHKQVKIVVITGGEPAMHNLSELTNLLKENGYRTHIETSGAYNIQGKFDWITLSPKKFKAPIQKMLSIADELKIIVFNKSDFKWGEEHAQSVHKKCKLFLQPEWSKHEKMQPLIINYVKQNPQWSISLQTHKYLKID